MPPSRDPDLDADSAGSPGSVPVSQPSRPLPRHRWEERERVTVEPEEFVEEVQEHTAAMRHRTTD